MYEFVTSCPVQMFKTLQFARLPAGTKTTRRFEHVLGFHMATEPTIRTEYVKHKSKKHQAEDHKRVTSLTTQQLVAIATHSAIPLHVIPHNLPIHDT